jgi:hypothetical protein
MRRNGRQWRSLVASSCELHNHVATSLLSLQALPGVVNGYALGTTSATNASTASTVLRTAESTIQQAFSSRVSIKALMELRYAGRSCTQHSVK